MKMSSSEKILEQHANLTIPTSKSATEIQEVLDVTRIDRSKYSKRVILRTILSRSDGGSGLIGERIVIGGWIKSSKMQGGNPAAASSVAVVKNGTCSAGLEPQIPCCLRLILRLFTGLNGVFGEKSNGSNCDGVEVASTTMVVSVAYLQVNDGSCISNLQVVVDSSIFPLSNISRAGASILVEGILRQPFGEGKSGVELKAEKIIHVGTVDLANYPLTKTSLTPEFLRSYLHLRPRENTVASVTRIRNTLTYATHTFFQNHGFLYVHTPVITTTDSRGGNSEMLQVTTLFSEADRLEKHKDVKDSGELNLEALRTSIKEKNNRVQELKRNDSNKETLAIALQDLRKAQELELQMEARAKLDSGTPFNVGKVDFSKDFFSRQAYLTMSGQLQLESYACALGSVYTFGPTFLGENSQSMKHLAELWMVEPEMAFAELEDIMNCVEDYMKFLCQSLLENSIDDMQFMANQVDKTCIARLHSVISTPFERIPYTKAIELLKNKEKTSESNIEWGMSLAEEHKSFLADEMYKRPVIIYDHPKEVKPFYARLNDDGKTVSTIDVVLPKVGTLIQGGQREERFDIISRRIQEFGLAMEVYEWYLDLRRHGSVKHSGFSLGFEQMVMFATGLDDVRDAIPFPRTRSRADC